MSPMLKPLLALIFVSLSSVGCVGIQSPTAKVISARVVDESATASRVIVVVKLTNPNDEELPMTRVSLDLEVRGGGRYQFTDLAYATLPANGEQTIELPASVSGSGLVGSVFEVRGRVVVVPAGAIRKVLTENGIPLPSTSFSRQGIIE